MSEKRFLPSARKLRKAREEGDIAKSRELTSVFVLLSLFIFICFEYFTGITIGIAVSIFRQSFILSYDLEKLPQITEHAVTTFLLLGGLLLGLMAVCALLAEVMQIGFRFSFKPLQFNIDRLNLFKGLKQRVFCFLRITELLKSATILLGLLFGFILFVWAFLEPILGTDFTEIVGLVNVIHWLLIRFILFALALCFIVAIADLLWQRKKRRTRLMMDVEEFKREIRENEGSPEIKCFRKSMHQEILLNSISQGVRKAKVVVVNKT